MKRVSKMKKNPAAGVISTRTNSITKPSSTELLPESSKLSKSLLCANVTDNCGSTRLDQSGSSTAELTTNVQVCARIRPLHSHSKLNQSSKNRRKRNDDTFVAWEISDDNTSAYLSSKTKKVQGRTDSYTLDRVFGTDATTDQIYEESVASFVKAAMEGYNSTVLAYGQTSTGKTHTLTGKRDDPGLIPLCVKDCFRYVRENMSDEPREYLFRFSYLEIYKEHIRDLLSSTNSAPEPVRLFDGPDGLVIRGVKEVVVSSPNKVFQLLKQGDRRRQVGATHMNQHSSRSHVVVRLQIESSFASSRSDETRVSVLSLVDLAGSESVRLNGADRREEGQYINKSLMALGQVVLGLSDPKKMKSHIPYRDSKLTRLLQSSLSGNAQMLMMCCISPEASHLEESHNTFKFATRAKRIEQKASIKTAKDTEDSLLQTYRNEIENLKKQLAEAAQQKEQLLAEQQAFQTIIEREEVSTENNELTEVLPTSNKTESSNMESTNGEIEGLVEAIQTMEQLILKSLPLQHNSNGLPTESGGTVRKNGGSLDMTSSGKELDGKPDSFLQSEDVDSEGDVDLLLENDEDIISKRSGSDSVVTPSKSAGFPPTTPHNDDRTTKDHLHSELTRVRGILATVLRKRGLAPTPRNDPPGVESFGYEKVRKSLDFSTPSGDPPPSRHVLDESLSEELNAGMDVDTVVPQVDSKSSKAEEKSEEKNHELESLRIQLKQQERATNLRKADSHFLQLQLEEKDKLLEEVSSLLEAVEKRQGDLEQENLALRRELNSLREERGEERSIIIRNSPF